MLATAGTCVCAQPNSVVQAQLPALSTFGARATLAERMSARRRLGSKSKNSKDAGSGSVEEDETDNLEVAATTAAKADDIDEVDDNVSDGKESAGAESVIGEESGREMETDLAVAVDAGVVLQQIAMIFFMQVRCAGTTHTPPLSAILK